VVVVVVVGGRAAPWITLLCCHTTNGCLGYMDGWGESPLYNTIAWLDNRPGGWVCFGEGGGLGGG
jgi:hypothetical protein